MGKSTKATVIRRVHDVLRLLAAGAEFAELRQFAADKGWGVSVRQLHRYMEVAYKHLAKATKRDRTQLLGRHLMQRRALYARCVKQNDNRTALQVLRDEAALQGIYPAASTAPALPDGRTPGSTWPPIGRRERLVRLIAAQARKDDTERRLVESATPFYSYRLPDTMLPAQMLNIMALMYVAEQLDCASLLEQAMVQEVIAGDPDGQWYFIGMASAYRFKIGQDGWQMFVERLGVDGGYLVRTNYEGTFLPNFGEKVYRLAPSVEELQAASAAVGLPMEEPKTAEGLASSWRLLFDEVCRE